MTGLAWTAAGGEILFIETSLSRGSGELILTGQLGDVMKKSARIAVSIVKRMYPEEAQKLEKCNLHIHVPAGAVPKDWTVCRDYPGDGADVSAERTAGEPEYAMTGEVSLTGRGIAHRRAAGEADGGTAGRGKDRIYPAGKYRRSGRSGGRGKKTALRSFRCGR